MLLACRDNDISIDVVKKMCKSMYWMFDMKTEEEAEEQGFKWYYNKL